MSLQWGKIYVTREELSLANVLQAGQAFRWILDENSGEYLTTMKIANNLNYSVVLLRQTDDKFIECSTYDKVCDLKDLVSHFESYFRTDVKVEEMHANEWLPRDPKFQNIETHGIRILGQEPWETLVSFICSTNNNISRITKMCHALCLNYGKKIGSFNSTEFYSFPSSDEIMNKATEAELRSLGFGYRAKYIIETAKRLVQNKKENDILSDTEFLMMMSKSNDYNELREHLMSYSGIGPKVADCICLMGMRKDHVVPVDVHVERIAQRDYRIKATNKEIVQLRELYKTLPITRKKVNFQLDYIRTSLNEKWGPYAGWAQGILFFREVGGTTGANTEGKIKKRKNDNINVVAEDTKQEQMDDIPSSKKSRIKSEQLI
ncbi:similar to Saccharomyces cerevisiae YML060W OGG1 Mitochondrial glycosylase/lyase that specifically excises 7,8-dihydro-8-oxoguanine residues located opposite cytosine or thymine residues in DNA [Maudiozyma barnettii]|uniref:N-glycosylase/DNA lyase n=1 Tax=Maudiozyma barnettii TaxID=61262 RepID=A0A8H2ZJY8_9SACH|nr:8-oxoguanine glycosylase OGG1 [Kazachstania barnettii]CAB4257012.1 similar to Saccharomyces cerevisiae YML060W OGG1 Mitochondrial glycosylase/lyase that specifically excises 7,8-dihydro-8-oxoguanine residues located opposite cytosine or thymine residues in DNA [Kazachstania barnettii]CAD1779383.1 similar to Saccharomyces cerevisiae YML060W OGG1 Mitochondrial glycosylase/lyase that specifically excises 7,8-dihydro-8-oxoguanine residues located opposite cytosine or thymine residues in DNA [Kazac